ncbi:c-type cytochrome [Phenylobacterium immobile]|jgi:mono/diheme cytochrome c family protein|uniref:c-type cytochrome n=1 Tax=Phenylobacterium immobile TaxID=21 RepID=UPI000AEAFB0F|nr:cytochrome c [Phenylobacterium immobile]
MIALLILIIALGLLASGCAEIPANPAISAPLTPAAERGRMLSERACSACHAVGLSAQSPWQGAPAFRNIRMSFTTISRQRRLAELTRTHVGMPPMEVSLDDMQDILTYIEGLRETADRQPTKESLGEPHE